jgi:hypothetical protein
MGQHRFRNSASRGVGAVAESDEKFERGLVRMPEVEVIPISERMCDLCNDGVTNEEHVVTKSFLLTDGGVICFQCWDERLTHPTGLRVEKIYVMSQKIDDEWVKRPLVFMSFVEKPG